MELPPHTDEHIGATLCSEAAPTPAMHADAFHCNTFVFVCHGCDCVGVQAKELLGWEAKYDLERMCKDTWRWVENNPYGYAGKP